MALVYRFEGWEFEPASGELRPSEGDPVRVQPQPAQLLGLLLERAGEVVTRDDIIGSVWADTKVEFDQAVNYAIRHLRSALGESAGEGRYIETLPRRGYRFVPPVTRHDDHAVSALTAGAARPARAREPRKRALAGVLAALLLGVWGVWGAWGVWDRSPGPAGAVGAPEGGVVAVLVLRSEPGNTSAATEARRTAERLTAELTKAAGVRARIVGPRTTEDYRAEPDVLRRLSADIGAAYLLSGSIVMEEEDGLFLELIRTSDGAHLWAMTGSPGPGSLTAAADSVATRLGWR